MGREPVRNLEGVKVVPTEVNEFEYQKNQGQLTEQLEHHQKQEESAVDRPTRAEQVEQITADAHAKVEERKRRATRKSGVKKATTKKPAARQSSTKRSVARKSGTRKVVAKKSATKRSSAKKSTGKKAATRKSTRKSTAKRPAPKR